jgi:hypothetical protein
MDNIIAVSTVPKWQQRNDENIMKPLELNVAKLNPTVGRILLFVCIVAISLSSLGASFKNIYDPC